MSWHFRMINDFTDFQTSEYHLILVSGKHVLGFIFHSISFYTMKFQKKKTGTKLAKLNLLVKKSWIFNTFQWHSSLRNSRLVYKSPICVNFIAVLWNRYHNSKRRKIKEAFRTWMSLSFLKTYFCLSSIQMEITNCINKRLNICHRVTTAISEQKLEICGIFCGTSADRLVITGLESWISQCSQFPRFSTPVLPTAVNATIILITELLAKALFLSHPRRLLTAVQKSEGLELFPLARHCTPPLSNFSLCPGICTRGVLINLSCRYLRVGLIALGLSRAI